MSSKSLMICYSWNNTVVQWQGRQQSLEGWKTDDGNVSLIVGRASSVSATLSWTFRKPIWEHSLFLRIGLGQICKKWWKKPRNIPCLQGEFIHKALTSFIKGDDLKQMFTQDRISFNLNKTAVRIQSMLEKSSWYVLKTCWEQSCRRVLSSNSLLQPSTLWFRVVTLSKL